MVLFFSHPDIGVRKPEPLWIARAMGMTKWFDELEASIDKLGIRCRPTISGM